MPREGKYDTINVRPDHQIKPAIDRLVEIIRQETGFQVTAGDAVNLAVKEAVKRREVQS